MSRNKRDISQVGKSERLKKRKDSEVSLFFFLSLWNLLITFTSPPVPPFALVPKFVPALATLLLSFSSLTSISPSFTWPSSPSPSLPSVPPSLSPLPITRRSMSRTAHFTAFKCWREILLGIIQQEMNPQMLLTPSHTPPPPPTYPPPPSSPPPSNFFLPRLLFSPVLACQDWLWWRWPCVGCPIRSDGSWLQQNPNMTGPERTSGHTWSSCPSLIPSSTSALWSTLSSTTCPLSSSGRCSGRCSAAAWLCSMPTKRNASVPASSPPRTAPAQPAAPSSS